MTELIISIVNYNAGEYLIDCLESIKKILDEAVIEVYIVDNASSDGSIEKAQRRFPDFKFILNKENLGFGKAHNQVLKKVNSKYLLVLNPDIRLDKGEIEKILDFMEKNPDVGAATGKIVFENGEMDLTAHRGFPTPLASLLYFLGDDNLYHLSKADMSRVHEVDAITGAFFFTRKDVLEKVGYFDEDFFMYAEDIDLCYRIKMVGFKVMFIPEIEILHFKGISSGLKKHTQNKSMATIETKKRALDYFYSTMKIFYKKHYEKRYPFFINWLVYLGINFKWFLAKRKLVV